VFWPRKNLTSKMQTELDVPVDKRQRVWELLLVLGVAFLSTIVRSLYSVLAGAQISPAAAQGSLTPYFLDALCRQATAFGVLFYVLAQQGRGLRQIGLAWRGRDVVFGVLLFLVAGLASSLGEYGLYYGGYFLSGHVLDFRRHNLQFLEGPKHGLAFGLLLLSVTINPFYEELLVRAYLMSEVQALTNRTGLAVFFSVAVQTSYHFYQGFWPAVTYIPLFLIFALYYARTRRILPVILAHMIFDLSYFFYH
jgi:membrane protease YdiL (CAAX protease family)